MLLISLVPLNYWATHVFTPFAPMLLMQAKLIHCCGAVVLVVFEVVLTKAH